ncbi:MAG: hypothetical protein QM601_03190, partial [Pseudoxanthomonas sp.]
MTQYSGQPAATAEPTPAPAGLDREGERLHGGWRDAVLAVAAHYQLNASPEHVAVAARWSAHASIEDQARQMARQAGLSLQWVQPRLADLTRWRLPVAVQLDGGQVAVATALAGDDLSLLLSGDEGVQTTRRIQELQPHVRAMAVLRPLQSAPDARVDDYIRPVEKHWLRSLVLTDWRPYAHIMLASLVVNLMSLGGVLFSMQVYDRVVP